MQQGVKHAAAKGTHGKEGYGKDGYWKGALCVFKSRRAVITAGMLLALHVILSMYLGIYLTQTVKLSVSFITNVVTGYLFGPWMALATGALGDILQYLLKPVGGYFFGWTLNAAIGGLAYGLAFYRKGPKEDRPLQTEGEADGGRRRAAVQDGKKQGGAVFGAVDFISAGILLLMLVCWLLLPFLDVTAKAGAQEEREVFNTGSALQYVTGAVGECANTSPRTLAVAAVVLIAAGLVFAVCRRRVLMILLSAAAFLWLLLPVYTDRSVLAVRTGFVLLSAGFGVCVLLNLLAVLRAKSLDAAFLLRCFLTMLFMAAAVQMFLGTLWCTVMYGKGFWFYFVPRAMKSMIQLPFNTLLAYYVIRALKQNGITGHNMLGA